MADVWKSSKWPEDIRVTVKWDKKKEWKNDKQKCIIMCKYENKEYVQVNRLEAVTSAALKRYYSIYKMKKTKATAQQFKDRHVLLANPLTAYTATVVISLSFLRKYIEPNNEYKNKKNYKVLFRKLQKEAKNEANDHDEKSDIPKHEEKENENCALIRDPKNIQTMQCIMNKNTLPTLKRNDRSRRQRPETFPVKKIGKKRINDCLLLLSMRSRDRAYYHGMLEDRVVSIRCNNENTFCAAIFYSDGSDEYLHCLKITNRDEEDEFNKHLQLEAESDFADICHVKIRDIAVYGTYSDRFISYCCDLFPGTLADLIHRFDGLGINARNTNTNSIVNSVGERKEWALFMGLQMFVALLDMHSRNYVHRDITENGELLVKLIDFGFVKHVNLRQKNVTVTVVGTDGYHAFKGKQWQKLAKARIDPNCIDSMGLVMTVLEMAFPNDTFIVIQKYLMKHTKLNRKKIARILDNELFADIAMLARSPLKTIWHEFKHFDYKRYVKLCKDTLSECAYDQLCQNWLFMHILGEIL